MKKIHSCVEVAPANFVTEASIASYATDYVLYMDPLFCSVFCSILNCLSHFYVGPSTVTTQHFLRKMFPLYTASILRIHAVK